VIFPFDADGSDELRAKKRHPEMPQKLPRNEKGLSGSCGEQIAEQAV
jgi:hypothetical protein